MYSYLDIDLYRRPNPPNRLHEYGRKLSEVTEEFLKILLLISISLISAITIEVRPDLSGTVYGTCALFLINNDHVL